MTDYYKELSLDRSKSHGEILDELLRLEQVWRKREITRPDLALEKLALIEQAKKVFASDIDRANYDRELAASDIPPNPQGANPLEEMRAQWSRWHQAAMQYSDAGQYDLAKAALDNALPYVNDSFVTAEFYRFLAEVYDRTGNHNSAIEYANKAIVLEPTNARHYMTKGDILNNNRQQYELAVNAAQKGSSAEIYALACGMLAWSYATCSPYEYGLAEQYAEIAVKYGDPNGRGQWVKGYIADIRAKESEARRKEIALKEMREREAQRWQEHLKQEREIREKEAQRQQELLEQERQEKEQQHQNKIQELDLIRRNLQTGRMKFFWFWEVGGYFAVVILPHKIRIVNLGHNQYDMRFLETIEAYPGEKKILLGKIEDKGVHAYLKIQNDGSVLLETGSSVRDLTRELDISLQQEVPPEWRLLDLVESFGQELALTSDGFIVSKTNTKFVNSKNATDIVALRGSGSRIAALRKDGTLLTALDDWTEAMAILTEEDLLCNASVENIEQPPKKAKGQKFTTASERKAYLNKHRRAKVLYTLLTWAAVLLGLLFLTKPFLCCLHYVLMLLFCERYCYHRSIAEKDDDGWLRGVFVSLVASLAGFFVSAHISQWLGRDGNFLLSLGFGVLTFFGFNLIFFRATKRGLNEWYRQNSMKIRENA